MYRRSFVIAAHITGWILFLSLVVLFVFRRSQAPDLSSFILSVSFLRFTLIFILFFYLNLFVLVPRLLLKQKYIAYIGCCLLMFVSIFFLKPYEKILGFDRHPMSGDHNPPPDGFDEKGPPPREDKPFTDRKRPERENEMDGSLHVDITSIILFIACMSVSGALCLTKRWRITEQRAARAEADKANAELSFLKTQINPHFLFNTLNNIYLLAVVKNDNTASSIMKLSNMMRYLTDEVSEDFVMLEGEVDCIKDYIDLQMLRLGNATKVNFTVEGATENKKIAPLVLMTFIENAFKHGVSKHEASFINIHLLVTDQQIIFSCSNKLFAQNKNTERTGIGLVNVRQRLNYLYADRYILLFNTDDGNYTVNLTIQI